jgi:hypothetical protein
MLLQKLMSPLKEALVSSATVFRSSLQVYKTIILDCQSIAGDTSCGDCVAYRSCELSKQKAVTRIAS